MESLEAPQGTFRLGRHPERTEALRAWDAADEYLLAEVAGRPLGALVLVNDRFGALATALAEARPTVLIDEVTGRDAARANLARRDPPAADVTIQSSLAPLEGAFDTALIKLPKAAAALEDQLHRLRPHLRPDSLVIGAGMARHVHTSTLAIFERLVGPTRTSLARKKARLIYATLDPAHVPGPNPWPRVERLASGPTVVSHAGVFSAERLDLGARFFLEHLPRSSGAVQIVDLGCGNGVVGVHAALANRAARVTCTDVSDRAVASARATFAANDVDGAFVVADCLAGVAPGSVDLVLNNPPFHDGHAIGDSIAWQMFREARDALRAGGALWVVGNRHLGYHAKLKRLFGHCETVAANPRFVVLRARR